MSEVIYKGLTRPVMFFGVPIAPLFFVSFVITLLSLWISMLFLTTIIPAVFILKEISKKDDFIFRLSILDYNYWCKLPL